MGDRGGKEAERGVIDGAVEFNYVKCDWLCRPTPSQGENPHLGLESKVRILTLASSLPPFEPSLPYQRVLRASPRLASLNAPLRGQVFLKRGAVASPRSFAITVLVKVSTHVPSRLVQELLCAWQIQKVQVGNPKAGCWTPPALVGAKVGFERVPCLPAHPLVMSESHTNWLNAADPGVTAAT